METADVHPSIVTPAMLRALSGLERATAVCRWANSQGIRTFDSRDGPWTTIELINAAGGLSPPGPTPVEQYSVEDFF